VAHVLPVADDAVFHGVGDLEEGTDCCGFVADHDVFYFEVVHAFFCAEDWAADNGGEGVLREVRAGVAKLPLSAFLHDEYAKAGREGGSLCERAWGIHTLTNPVPLSRTMGTSAMV